MSHKKPHQKNTIVQPDDKIHFESRPDFGIEKKIEEKEEEKEEKTKEIKITPLKDTFVHTPTQKAYNQLMKIYEHANWQWGGGGRPTRRNHFWDEYKKDTIISIINRLNNTKGKFQYGTIEAHGKDTIITLEGFIKEQNITPEQLQAINEHYDKK